MSIITFRPAFLHDDLFRACGRFNVCPFIDRADARCADHLTFRNLTRAFAHCADHYAACPIYRRLTAKECSYERVESASQLLAAF